MFLPQNWCYEAQSVIGLLAIISGLMFRTAGMDSEYSISALIVGVGLRKTDDTDFHNFLLILTVYLIMI